MAGTYSGARIAVLVRAGTGATLGAYLVASLVECWRRQGHEVVVLEGPDRFEPADVLILHVDLSVVPEEYVDLVERYSTVINRSMLDIRKRTISSNILQAGEDYEGPVIVKTDRNCGGVSEHAVSGSRLLRAMTARLPWLWTGKLLHRSYPVYDSASAVPNRAWDHPELVVERYLPEREGEYNCLRQWVFLGDREVSQRCFSRDAVVKSDNIVHREEGVPIPPALRAMRARLGSDYGKFDYVLKDGTAHLLDANTTPTVGRRKTSGSLNPLVEELAPGLDMFLRKSAGQPTVP